LTDTRYWDVEEIARQLRKGITIARKAVAQPDFPQPIRLWQGAHPIWVAEEVMEWIEARREAA